MINLLSSETRSAQQRDYHRRLWLVAGLLFAALIAVGLGLNLLFYFNLRVQARTIQQALAGARATDQEQLATENEVKSAVALAEAFAHQATRVAITTEWQKVLAAKLSGITLTDWLWTAEETGVIKLAGRAVNRRALLDFVEKLKNEPTFASVESPVTNLIKSENLNFTLTIVRK